MQEKKAFNNITLGCSVVCVIPLIQHFLDTTNAGIIYLAGNAMGINLFIYAVKINIFLFLFFVIIYFSTNIYKVEIISFMLLCFFLSSSIPFFGERLQRIPIPGIIILYVVRPVIIVMVTRLLLKIKEKSIDAQEKTNILDDTNF